MITVRICSALARVGTTGGIVLVLALALVVGWATPLDPFAGAIVVLASVGVVGLLAFPGARRTLLRRTGVSLAAWAAAGIVFLGGVALTYALGSPEPFCERQVHRGCLTDYGLGSALFLAGTVAGAVALGNAGRYRALAGTPVTGAGTVRPGNRAVVGRVVPAGETRRTPAGAEAVWYRYEVAIDADDESTVVAGENSPGDGGKNSPGEGRDHPTGGGRTVASGCEFVRFYVEDGSGRLLVVPREVDGFLATRYAASTTTTVEAGDRLAVDAGVPADRPRRIREWRIEPDDVLFAAGQVTEVSRAEYPAGAALGLDGEVRLAAASRDEVVGTVRQRVLVGAILAVLVGGLGYATMVLSL